MISLNVKDLAFPLRSGLHYRPQESELDNALMARNTGSRPIAAGAGCITVQASPGYTRKNLPLGFLPGFAGLGFGYRHLLLVGS